jgi:hypothetical protein
MHTVFWLENMKGKDLSQGVDGRIRLERISRKEGRMVWTGCIWLRIGTSGGLL